MRSTRVLLYHLWPPRARVVTVRAFTVGSYIRFMARAAEISNRIGLSSPGKVTPESVLAFGLRASEWAALADVLCPAERPGFFRPYVNQPNLHAMTRAAGDLALGGVNDWRRIDEEFNVSGRRSRGRDDGISLQGLVALLAGRYPSLSPFEIYQRDLIELLDFCEGIADAAREPEPDRERPADPLSSLAGMGLGVVH